MSPKREYGGNNNVRVFTQAKERETIREQANQRLHGIRQEGHGGQHLHPRSGHFKLLEAEFHGMIDKTTNQTWQNMVGQDDH